jgi:hypothetical protein
MFHRSTPAGTGAPGLVRDALTEQVPDSVLRQAIRQAELIVLGTPLELASQKGFLTPRIRLGARETWYDVRLAVDTVLKGRLKRAKRPDFGQLPAVLVPPPSFDHLAANEIGVQSPVVSSRASNWTYAVPLVPGERAVLRGPDYKANPLVALGGESKLRPEAWPRVARLVAELQRQR